MKNAIYAANRITRKPYRYGGGHGSFTDSAYDCSGSVSYALHGGGIHLRFLFSAPYAKDPLVDLAPGSVAVSLPAPRITSKPPR